jgi:hypothetical protein
MAPFRIGGSSRTVLYIVTRVSWGPPAASHSHRRELCNVEKGPPSNAGAALWNVQILRKRKLFSQQRSVSLFLLPLSKEKQTSKALLSVTPAESGRTDLRNVSFGIPGQPDSGFIERFKFLFRICRSLRRILLCEPLGHFLLLPFFPLLLFLTLLEGLWSTTGHKYTPEMEEPPITLDSEETRRRPT